MDGVMDGWVDDIFLFVPKNRMQHAQDRMVGGSELDHSKYRISGKHRQA